MATATPLPKGAVVLDAGHGGYDPGAVGPNGLRESELNLAVSRRAAASLEAAGFRTVLTRSDNFYAEMLLKEVGRVALGWGSTENGVAASRRPAQTAGVALGDRAADGSGLSRDNTRPAREWQALLVAARSQPWFGRFVDALPLAGRTGTLASRFTGTPSAANVRAQTGSVRETRSLSGYPTTAGGRQVVFSLVVNSSPVPAAVIAAMDDLSCPWWPTRPEPQAPRSGCRMSIGEVNDMHAQVSDRLVIHGAKVGQPDRVGEILELVPGHGAQRFRVRWSDGRESIYSPGLGAEIDTEEREKAEWKAHDEARRAYSAARRRGITAGVGREASLAQEKLDRRAAGAETPATNAG